MGTRVIKCDLGCAHGISFCDRCEKDIGAEEMVSNEMVVRRRGGAFSYVFCTPCVEADETLRLAFSRVPGFCDLTERGEKVTWPK